MNKEITLGGLAALPSDYESPDGQLALSVNLLHEDGVLRPVLAPAAILNLGQDWNAFLFKTPAQAEHYILWKEVSGRTLLRAIDTSGSELSLPLSEITDTVCSLSAIGNIVLISCSGNIHYLLWKPVTSEYRYLGTGLPEISIDLALHGDIESLSYDTGGMTVIEDSSTDQTVVGEWQGYLSEGFDLLYASDKYYSQANYYLGAPRYSSSVPLQFTMQGVKFEKGKSYRVQPTLFKAGTYPDGSGGEKIDYGRMFRIYLFAGKPELGNIRTADHIFEVSNRESKVFTPNQDYDDIWYCVLTVEASQVFMTGEIRIEVTEANTLYEDCKVIKYTKEACDAVCAAINSFIAEKAHAKNRFIYPFFVRYAIRLYDGSYAAISSPRLMIPNSGYVPFVFFREQAPQLAARAFVCDLAYRIISPPDLSDWTDLIAGVDIFVSEEVWPYDQGKEYDPTEMNFSFVKFNSANSFGILRATHGGTEFSGGKYTQVSLESVIEQCFDTNTYQPMLVEFGKRPDQEYMDKFLDIANFYRVYQIPFNDLTPGDFIIPELEKGALSSLSTRPVLDQYNVSYSGYGNMRIHSYNGRLHLFGGNVRLPDPDFPDSLNSFISNPGGMGDIDIYVFLHTSEGDRIAHRHIDDGYYSLSLYHWFFYPDSRAYKAVFVQTNRISDDMTMTNCQEVTLKQHPLLNGVYAIAETLFSGIFQSQEGIHPGQPVSYDPLPFVSATSSIYVSEAMNPFAFRASSVASVGSTRVLALSSAAKALSQGQFGQFPLYAFTDEGVWALSVSSTGSYTAVQPITRDVCTAPDSITQLDSAVLFVSARGLMILEGSSVSPLTDLLNTRFPEAFADMPHFRELTKMILPSSEWAAEGMPLAPFPDYLQGASAGLPEVSSSPADIIYDYTHQRIILFNPSLPYAYVLSLKSRKWGMILSDIARKVNSYPEALAVDHSGRLVDFSRESAVSSVQSEVVSAAALLQSPVGEIPCLVLTRALKLDAPDILKRLEEMAVRGDFPFGAVKTAIYGSRDLIHWHLVSTSTSNHIRAFRSTPYKYHRIVALASLPFSASLSSLSFVFTPAYTNRLR